MNGIELTNALRVSVEETAWDRVVGELRERAAEYYAMADEISAQIEQAEARGEAPGVEAYTRVKWVAKGNAMMEAAKVVEEGAKRG